jgi:hypothetical protein
MANMKAGREKESLSELFGPKHAGHVDWPDDDMASSTINGKKLIINFRESEGMVQLEFNIDHEFQLTGRGDATAVFATVIESIKEYVGNWRGVHSFVFTADEQSRAKMYDTLAKRVAKQLGWHVVPYDDMVKDPKYQTVLSYGDFTFAIEKGTAPASRLATQKPQHGDFLPVFYVVSMEDPTLPAYKIKSKNGNDAERWVMNNVPEYKDLDAFGVIARRVPPNDRPVIDKGRI